MAKKFTGVGASFAKNASVLLNEAAEQFAVQSDMIRWLPRESIIDNPFEMETYGGENGSLERDDELMALARNIAERGIQIPTVVIPAEGDKYILIGGHRRKYANDIAVDELGYAEGEKIPCIVAEAPAVGHEYELRERMIFDNLNRTKTDYTRMMEIIGIEDVAEKRKKNGENIQSIREYIKDHLGVSDPEITRYKKVYSSLHEGLMPAFKNQQIAATVAYTIATLPAEEQDYINENWDHKDVLSLPTLNMLIAQYSCVSSKNEHAKQERNKKAPHNVPLPQSMDEGVHMLSAALKGIDQNLAVPTNKIGKAEQKRILKKVQKHIVALAALQDELLAYGMFTPSTNGEELIDG